MIAANYDTVLLIDDNESIHTLFDHVADDYSVEHALTGEEGIQKAIDKKPSIILLDINLDDMSGYDVCEKLKALKETSGIPVVFLSAWGGTKARLTGYSKGAANYIEKPFQIREVNAIVHSIIKDAKRKIITTDIMTYGRLEVHYDQHEVFMNGELKHMTQNEFKILSTLLKNPNEIVSREDLLHLLSPTQNEHTSRVIDTHVSSIRKKVQGSGVSIKTIHAKGYKAVITE